MNIKKVNIIKTKQFFNDELLSRQHHRVIPQQKKIWNNVCFLNQQIGDILKMRCTCSQISSNLFLTKLNLERAGL